MKYLVIALILLAGCATVDCRDKDWQSTCTCNSDQIKCNRWLNRR